MIHGNHWLVYIHCWYPSWYHNIHYTPSLVHNIMWSHILIVCHKHGTIAWISIVFIFVNEAPWSAVQVCLLPVYSELIFGVHPRNYWCIGWSVDQLSTHTLYWRPLTICTGCGKFFIMKHHRMSKNIIINTKVVNNIGIFLYALFLYGFKLVSQYCPFPSIAFKMGLRPLFQKDGEATTPQPSLFPQLLTPV